MCRQMRFHKRGFFMPCASLSLRQSGAGLFLARATSRSPCLHETLAAAAITIRNPRSVAISCKFIIQKEGVHMSLKYTCPVCGTPMGYKGLCWKCRCWTGEGYGPSLESGASEGKTGRAGPEYPAAGRYGGSGAYGLLEALGYRDAGVTRPGSSGRRWPRRFTIPVSFIITPRRMCGTA